MSRTGNGRESKIRPLVTKKRRGRNKTKQIIDLWRARLGAVDARKWTQSSYLQRYIVFSNWTSLRYHSPILCPLSTILSTFLTLCPHFRVYVHILEYLSTFRNTCPYFGISVHISEYTSTYPSKCPHFRKYVHLMKFLPFLSLYYPIFIL